MLELVITMGMFALIGSVTPGPVNILAVRRSATANRLAALSYVLGASASYTLVVWLMGLGGEQLLRHIWVVETIRWSGAAYLLYLAWCIAKSTPSALPDPRNTADQSVIRAFIDGTITQTSNPKAWMVATSGIGLFVLPQSDTWQALMLFCAVSLVACSVGVGCWALAGKLLVRWLAAPQSQRRFNQAMGALLAASVINMLR